MMDEAVHPAATPKFEGAEEKQKKVQQCQQKNFKLRSIVKKYFRS